MNRSSSPQRDAFILARQYPLFVPSAYHDTCCSSECQRSPKDTTLAGKIGSDREQGRQTTQPDRTTTGPLSRLLTNQEVVRRTHTQKTDTAGVTVTTVTVTQQGSWPPPPSPPPPPPLPVADFLRSFVENPSQALPENG